MMKDQSAALTAVASDVRAGARGAVLLAGVRLQQPQDAAAGRALAAPRLADQPEHLALVD